MKEVCAFHHGEGAGQSQDTPTFLSTVSQDTYHKAEDDYLAQLTAYTKKQFQVWPCTKLPHDHNNIVAYRIQTEMVNTPASQEI